MDFWVWVQTVGAVFVGNLMSAVFGYAILAIWRDERRGGDGWGLPRVVYVCGGLPLLIAAAIVYSLN